MKTSVLFSLFLLSTLSACATTNPAPPRPASAASVKPLSAEAFRQEFLQHINRIRSTGCNCGSTFMQPVPPLTWNRLLENAALLHASDMNAYKYFSHTDRAGRTSKDRIMNTGYTLSGYKSIAVGENIAWGQRSVQEVIEGWLKSEGHCRNIMNPSFSEVGIAMVNYYWVQDFGGRKPFDKARK